LCVFVCVFVCVCVCLCVRAHADVAYYGDEDRDSGRRTSKHGAGPKTLEPES